MVTLPYPRAVEAFPRLRQSLLSDFDNCFRTGHLSVKHETGWSSHPAARGTIVHRTLARSLEKLEEFGLGEGGGAVDVPVDIALEELEQVLRQAEEPLAAEPGQEGEEVVCIPLREIAEARISVKTWAYNQRFTLSEFAGVERRLEATVAYPDENGEAVERLLTGKPDLLLIAGEDATVVDWKDTWGIPSEGKGGTYAPEEGAPPSGDNVSEEGYFQQRFYAMLVFHRYPRIQRVTLRETYVRYLSGTVKDRKGRTINPVRTATIERSVLPEIEMEMSALVERFDRAQEAYLAAEQRDGETDEAFERRRSRVFRPAPGSHCSYCVDPWDCPVLPAARQVGRIRSGEEAETFAARRQVAQSAAKQYGDSLRNWSRAHGDVAVKDAKRPRVYGPVVRTRNVKPTAAEVEKARRAGTPIESLYYTEEYTEFCVHTPEEVHPFAKQAREEEEMLLAAEKREAS